MKLSVKIFEFCHKPLKPDPRYLQPKARGCGNATASPNVVHIETSIELPELLNSPRGTSECEG
jgi:hypothetical protein